MKRRARNIGLTVLTILLLMAGAFYFLFVQRATTVTDAEGWHLEFSYIRLACRQCTGRAEVLTYRGAPVDPPRWRWKDDEGNTPMAFLVTPVGKFEITEHERTWRLGHHGPYMQKSEQPTLTPEELAQGWYDAVPPDDSEFVKGFGPFGRKTGTPAHWCLTVTYDAARWMDPVNLEKVGW